MQLPAGLTQRHFDVWCAGGLLLTDANPGLAIFPGELTAPVTFTAPDELMPLFASHRADASTAQDLRHAWQELLLAEHTYAHRVDTILTRLCL
jgi:spore maturation protein CgeB